MYTEPRKRDLHVSPPGPNGVTMKYLATFIGQGKIFCEAHPSRFSHGKRHSQEKHGNPEGKVKAVRGDPGCLCSWRALRYLLWTSQQRAGKPVHLFHNSHLFILYYL